MKINEEYPCKRIKCERHGDCAACKEHHKNVKHTLLLASGLSIKMRKLKKRKRRGQKNRKPGKKEEIIEIGKSQRNSKQRK